jgi:DNA-binding transcriptional ArsR family regulator
MRGVGSSGDESGQLPHVVIEAIGGLMAALADPKRIALLEALRGGEANVQQLADTLDLTHRNASHHAAVLHRAGLLSRRREGREAVYGIEDWTALWLIDQAAQALADPDA